MAERLQTRNHATLKKQKSIMAANQQTTILAILRGMPGSTTRLVFVITALLLLGVNVLSLHSLHQLTAHAEHVARTVKVVAQVKQVMVDVLEVQNGVRGFIIAGEDQYLNPYLAALKVVEEDVQQLRLLTQDNPEQRRRMTELEAVVQKHLDFAKGQITIRQTQGYTAAQKSVASGTGHAILERLRAIGRDFVAEEGQRLLERNRLAKSSADFTEAIIVGLGLLTLLILLLADWRIRRDAAKRRQAEKERDRLFNLALDLYAIANFNGYFTQVNPAWEKTLGWSAAEILARPYIELVHPDDHESTLHAASTLVDGHLIYSFENRYLAKDGSYHWFSWVSYPDNEEGLIFAIARDVTEKKLQEVALRLATAQAQRADIAKSAFLATMSHELRTPLNGILGFSAIMQDGLLGTLNEKQQDAISVIFISGTHLLALINDVLDLSKIEAGQLEVSKQPFDVRLAVQQVRSLVAPLLNKKGLALHVQIAPDLAYAIADRRRVEQVLLNLLSNAIKFTERGQITLSVQPIADTAAMRLSVADSGMGIKAEDLAALFQPFHQLDSTLARNHEPTGLGLTICRHLVHLMGGEVSVESEWGRGSTFSFTLVMEPVYSR